MKKSFICLLFFFGSVSILKSDDTEEEKKPIFKDFSISVYGNIIYSNFKWQTEPNRKDSIDINRFTLEPKFKINEKMFLLAEIEFEHGGTGSTLSLEDSGGVETEVEKGGEVVLEQLFLGLKISREINFKFGHMIVPIGLNSKLHKPTESFLTDRSTSEIALMPNVWHETGIEFYGESHNFRYEAQIVNSLDSSGFNSGDWIHEGERKSFETVNAEKFAFVLRGDYGSPKKNHIGISFYIGDTNGNRPANDIEEAGMLSLIDIHGSYTWKGFTGRFNYIHFFLSDSEAISVANGESVGSQAMLAYGEIAYDVLTEFESAQTVYVFMRYDFYDSMLKTQGAVVHEPGTERKSFSFGVNYFPNPKVVFKAQYQIQTIDVPTDNRENTFSMSVGFAL